MRDICRQDCDSEAVGGRSRGFSAQFRPLITQALIHTSSHWTELQKSLHGCISSQNYMVTGVYILSNISVPASDYPSSDTHKLSLDIVAKKVYRVYIFTKYQFRPLITQALIHTSSHWTKLHKKVYSLTIK